VNTKAETGSLTSPQTITAMLGDLLAHDRVPRPTPPLTYLRRKAGRGLVAVYGDPADPAGQFTVTVAEDALRSEKAGQEAALSAPHWQGSWPGLVTEPAFGLAVQTFPIDATLPALRDAVAPAPSSLLWSTLAAAGSASLPAAADWTLRDVQAVPVRYKPGDRCVLRYRLDFERRDSGEHARTSVIGKVYREPEQATAAAALLTRLRASAAGGWCPAPLGSVDALALALSEDLGERNSDPPTRIGTEVVRPGHAHATATIEAAARALADLHASDVAPAATGARTASDEAGKAAKRGRVLADYLPARASTIAEVAGSVAERLQALEPVHTRPSHGSYKPSQLLVRGDAIFLVDFDQFCLADPALDVGYFLAYLRPPGMFYRRRGTREWFRSAARTFTDAYRDAMADRGVPPADITATLQRSPVYEAALLLKIAARRPNRLHSPRPGEVESLLAEIGSCLRAARG
jgi:hypothetical protein